jgi:hypothetical protein
MPMRDHLIGGEQSTAAFVEEFDGLLVASPDVIKFNHIAKMPRRSASPQTKL